MTPDIKALRAIAPIKTWSLLVTVFGDLRAVPSRPLRGAFLNQLFHEMGFRPEALRVALHRLAKDDWIKSHKTGRTSEYSLTARGEVETDRARERVYLERPAKLGDWHCLVFGSTVEEVDVPHVRLSPTCLAAPKAVVPQIEDSLILNFQRSEIPSWVEKRCLSDEMWQIVDALHEYFSDDPMRFNAADDMRRMAVRMLGLHHWRRLVLRDGFWLHADLCPQGRPRRCQGAMLRALGALANREDA